MSILDFKDKLIITKETKSQIVAECPVCGEDNLKISLSPKAYGAFRCWSCYSPASTIKEKLGIREKNKNSPFRKKSLPSPFAKQGRLNLRHSPVSFTGTKLFTSRSWKPLKTKNIQYQNGDLARVIIYPYGSSFRTRRIDNLTQSSKFVFLQYLDKQTHEWKAGTNNTIWPPYIRDCDFQDGDTALVVEGEKTAEVCKEKGISAITLASHCFYSNTNFSFQKFLKDHSSITNFVFVPDFDESGKVKATNFQQLMWSMNKSCLILPMTTLVSKPFKGMDLADVKDFNITTLQDAIDAHRGTTKFY